MRGEGEASLWQGALTVASVAALREAAEGELRTLGLPAEPGSELQYMDYDFEEWTAMVSDDELGASLVSLSPPTPKRNARPLICTPLCSGGALGDAGVRVRTPAYPSRTRVITLAHLVSPPPSTVAAPAAVCV